MWAPFNSIVHAVITRSNIIYELATAEANGSLNLTPEVFVAAITFLSKLESLDTHDAHTVLDSCLPEWKTKLGMKGSMAVSYAQLCSIVTMTQRVLGVKNGFDVSSAKAEIRRGQIWARNGREWRVHDLFVKEGAIMVLLKHEKDGDVVTAEVLRSLYRKTS